MTDLRAVITDLDGTLLNDRGYVHPDDLKTLSKLREHGVRTLIATGRHPDLFRFYLPRLGTMDAAIACNGTLLYDPSRDVGEVLDQFTAGQLERLDRFCRREGLYFNYYTSVSPYFCRRDPRLSADGRSVEMHKNFFIRSGIRSYEEWRGLPEEPVVKASIPTLLPEQMDRLQREFADLTLELYHSPCCVEMEPPDCGKGPGLKKAAQKLRFPLEKTLVIGDSSNDISMFRVAGFAAAPANVSPEAEPYIAYRGTDNNHAPITDIVRHFAPELLQ